ncbi:MAG: benzoate/H(+) symporter BenE family transporter [Bdellovibrio sp.]|nr:benzoate/H(+) symporter BenE family transporter [Bdellovibrio sp.]
MLSKLKSTAHDFSISTITAGLVTNLVGFASSAILVYQAAITAGATPTQASSWLGVICISIGLLTAITSYYYKMPTLFSWSTAGAALLITSLQGVSLAEATGAFIFSAFLIFLCGASGYFEKLIKHVPVSIASGMLAGVLLRFSLDVFISMKTQLILATAMFIIYILFRRISPRYSVLMALITGFAVAWFQNLMHFENLTLNLSYPQFTIPQFTFSTLLSVGLPLFIVTMTSQNLTGMTILRAFGYTRAPISRLITLSGLVNLIAAPFGGFAINLSAVTAAICMGPEAHPDPERRYTGGITSGIFYVIIGLFAGFVSSLFAAFPKELVATLAGLALIGTIGQSLASAIEKDSEREAAFITFITTASGVTLFGIGAAFWGLISGALVTVILKYKKLN